MSRAIDLLDVNVWVGLSLPEHNMHERANHYYRTQASPHLAFCRTTALGLLRVTMNKNSFGGVPLNLPEAWQVYRKWRASPDVVLLQESVSEVEELLDKWVQKDVFPPQLWTDAYLAAFAISASLRLVTFDKDFEKFPGLDLVRL